MSGLLELTIRICTMIADKANVPFDEVLDYITSDEGAWDFHPSPDSGNDRSEADWERALASLDTAILSLLDSETEEVNIDSSLTQALESSLFSRLLPSKSQAEQEMLLSSSLRELAISGPQQTQHNGVGFTFRVSVIRQVYI